MWKKIIDFLTLELYVNPNYRDSRNDAKNRLKVVLLHDRSKIAPGIMEKMKAEIIDVIARYVDIDKKSLDLKLENEADTLALIANIPILSKREKATVS